MPYKIYKDTLVFNRLKISALWNHVYTKIFRIPERIFTIIFSFIMYFHIIFLMDHVVLWKILINTSTLWRVLITTSIVSTAMATTICTTMIMIIFSFIIFRRICIWFWKHCWTIRTKVMILYQKLIIFLATKRDEFSLEYFLKPRNRYCCCKVI